MRIISRAIHIFACVLTPIMFCFSAGELMLPLAIAVFVHEVAHIAALKACGGKLKSLAPAPFGLCMEFDESTLSLGGEAIVSVAGCTANLICALMSVLLYKYFEIDFLNFGVVSIVLALVNFIPTEPLDGGRILKIVIAYFKGPEVAETVTSVITYIFGFFVFLVSSYSLLTSQSGVYPLLFSVYLFGRNAKMLEKVTFGENGSI